MHDLERLVDLVAHFNLPLTVCINKSTLHPENTKELISWCTSKAITIAGQLSYSDSFLTAVQSEKTVMEIGDEDIKEQMRTLWQSLAEKLDVLVVEEKIGFFRQKFNIFRYDLD